MVLYEIWCTLVDVFGTELLKEKVQDSKIIEELFGRPIS
jgi:hypothetical protein